MDSVVEEKKGQGQGNKFDITVIYNGEQKPVEVRHGERVKDVLDRAIQKFSPLPQPHTMSLFTEAGVELQDGDIVDKAGIRPNTVLLLRPSAVKGG